MPRRRTFAAALLGLRSLDADFAMPSMASLVSNAGSRGTGSPSLDTVSGRPNRLSDGEMPAMGRRSYAIQEEHVA